MPHIQDPVSGAASTVMTNYSGKAGRSPLPDELNILNILPKVSAGSNTRFDSNSSVKKHKRHAKFKNTQDSIAQSDDQKGPSVNPQTGQQTNDRLFELLHAEAEKQVEHFENLCREDKVRLAHMKRSARVETIKTKYKNG